MKAEQTQIQQLSNRTDLKKKISLKLFTIMCDLV